MTRENFPPHGFAWNKEDKRCLGIKNAYRIDAKETKWESCIFSGKLIFLNKFYCVHSIIFITFENYS